MDLFQRLYRILRSNLNVGESAGPSWGDFSRPADSPPPRAAAVDPQLARYYANLEVPYGSDLEKVRRAWKRLLKKYHPDRHHRDPEKRRVANQLTAELTRAYRELEAALANKEKQ